MSSDRDVSRKRTFSSDNVLTVKGRIFAMLVKGEFVAKLPEERVGELVTGGKGEHTQSWPRKVAPAPDAVDNYGTQGPGGATAQQTIELRLSRFVSDGADRLRTRGRLRARALAAGCQTHVPKPVEPAELIAAIADVTGHYKILDETPVGKRGVAVQIVPVVTASPRCRHA